MCKAGSNQLVSDRVRMHTVNDILSFHLGIFRTQANGPAIQHRKTELISCHIVDSLLVLSQCSTHLVGGFAGTVEWSHKDDTLTRILFAKATAQHMKRTIERNICCVFNGTQ